MLTKEGKVKNIIRIIGVRTFLLIGISLMTTSLLVEAANAEKPERQQSQLEIGLPKGADRIKLSNVRDTTFNVSWITRTPQSGYIKYGINPNNLNNVCYDDRGEGTVDDTHYVTIKNLSPNTLYYFNVISGGRTYDKGGRHFTCTTGPTIGLPGSKTIYGQVFKKDGSNADGTIVYVTIKDKDGAGSSGSSAEMSCLVSSGYWTVNLGNTRTKDLNGYFGYSSSGDELILFAQGGNDGVDIKSVDTGTQLPIPALRLKGGHLPKEGKSIDQQEFLDAEE